MNDSTIISAKNAAPEPTWPALSHEFAANGITCLLGPQPKLLGRYLRMLGGVEAPGCGELDICGKPVQTLSAYDWLALRRQIGFVSHQAPLLSVLNGLENVVLPALYHKTMARRDAECATQFLLAALGCEADLTLLPAYLTPLQRTQLAIARAAILEPSLLLLEEPFHTLELHEHESISSFLEFWGKEHGLLLSTCQLRFVKERAAKIIFAAEAEILYFDSWQSFIDSDATAVSDYLQRYRDTYYL